MYPQENLRNRGEMSAKKYNPPDLEIVLFAREDVITKSEIGGQWPWGEAQGANFGE